MSLLPNFRKLVAGDDGAVMLEYGLLVLLIALVVVGLVGVMGNITVSFLNVSAYL